MTDRGHRGSVDRIVVLWFCFFALAFWIGCFCEGWFWFPPGPHPVQVTSPSPSRSGEKRKMCVMS